MARVGTDIVGVDRVADLVAKGGAHFLRRWYTADEIKYCESKAHPEQHFAARLAAKESVLKVLRCSWDGPPQWRAIEVVHDDAGGPALRLSGEMAERAEAAGVEAMHLSLSHCTEYATATVVAETRAQGAVTAAHPTQVGPAISGMSATNCGVRCR